MLLAAGVTALMAYIALTTLCRFQVTEHALLRWGRLAVASIVARVGLVLGTGLCAAPVLSLGAQGLDFPIGYATGRALMLWLGGCVAATLIAALPAWSRRAPVLFATGALLGLLALALQCGWIIAAGFRPGIEWSRDFVGAAAAVQVMVYSLVLWMSLSTTVNGNDRSRVWLFGAICLLLLGMAASQELLVVGADLTSQIGSVYSRHLPGTLLCVVAGAVVPMVYAFMLLRQALYRHSKRRGGRREFDRLPGARRSHRRRHRVPTL